MLLTNSISNTKKFFRRTFQNFKSFFSTTEYQRLPKTHSPLIHYSHPELENLNNTHQWDSEKEKKNKAERRIIQEKEEYHHHQSPVQNSNKKKKQIEKRDNERKNMMMIGHKKGKHGDLDSDSAVRNCMVERKLRELELLDMGNVEYVLDIEEVLHYYSRLTCPAYLEIVDNFFMQMYSEFFAPLPKLPHPNQQVLF